MKPNLGYQDYYDDYWKNNKEWTPHRTMTKIEREIFGKYFSRPDMKVLDFGCGAGYFCGDLLSKKIKEYAGLDISAEGVKEARAKGLNVNLFDIEKEGKLPFSDGYFDGAVSSEVLEHLFNPEQVVREIYRVLKPGGIFYTSVPNAVFIKERLRAVFGGFNPKGHPTICKTSPWLDPHIRFFTRKSFCRLLETAGFRVKELRGEEFTPLCELGLPGKMVYGKTAKAFHGVVGFLGDLLPSLFATKFMIVAIK